MSPNILRIAVPTPLARTFDYLAPRDAAALVPGLRVSVDFAGRRLTGVIDALAGDSACPPEALKPVLAVLDDTPLLPPALLELARWAARYYQHPLGEVYAAMLPGALRHGRAAQDCITPGWRISAAGAQALAGGQLRAGRQLTLLQTLAQAAGALDRATLRALHADYCAPLNALLKRGWVEAVAAAGPLRAVQAGPEVNAEQQAAIDAVTAADGFGAFLLDGITGSGKTEVYLRLIEATLARGRQALVLVPEIGLTPQLLTRFRVRLSGRIAVLHSRLAAGERADDWLAAAEGRAEVVIGTRSAVFAPLARPGLIVVDEEHDASYKQQEGWRYSARDLAVVRARLERVPVLLGSATPSLETLANAQRGRYGWLKLTRRATGARTPQMELIDLRRQPLDEGLSRPLLQRVRTHLDAGGQVMLFLNRRGFAPALFCHACGWLAECPHCAARLTVHQRRRQLICHHCGYTQRLAHACPQCGAEELLGLGHGTERLEQALMRHFPDVGIARIDRDSTQRKGSLERLLDAVQSGDKRLLLGTQMLAKGHHFPAVTLVGIVDADQGLHSLDFRAAERLAQLVVQVAGRAGRAERPGSVVIQTHHPEHPLFATLLHADYARLAEALLAERRTAQLPPFAHQALLRAEDTDAEAAQALLDQAAALADALTADGAVQCLGPVPAPMERRGGRWRMQLLFEAAQRSALHTLLERLLPEFTALPAARRVRWSLDVDPLDLY